MSKSSTADAPKSMPIEFKRIVIQAIDDHVEKQNALLLVLHQIQDELKHVPDFSVPIIAKALNLSQTDIYGVISFYHAFTSAVVGQQIIRVCRGDYCQANGGHEIASELQTLLGIELGETTDDGFFSLESVSCLGNCDCSPSVGVGGKIYGKVSPEDIGTLIASLSPVIDGKGG